MKIKDIKDPSIRAKALKYAKENYNEITDNDALDLTVRQAFIWIETPEGSEFWDDIDNNPNINQLDVIATWSDEDKKFYKDFLNNLDI